MARTKSIVILVILAVLGAGVAILFALDPARHGFYPRCVFHSVTGLHCPGCGALRGAHLLLHGHLTEALRMNALVFLFLPVASIFLFLKRRAAAGTDVSRFVVKPAWLWSALAVAFLFWILRNLPFYPFTLLAPSA
ncbi:MAG TPA: DUF2752 domain-containing protein [Verrucomicrobiae bacterium]|nr:DUF2752 domain-containing protein [Verrucomicrobiae bacterium]